MVSTKTSQQSTQKQTLTYPCSHSILKISQYTHFVSVHNHYPYKTVRIVMLAMYFNFFSISESNLHRTY